MSGRGSVRQLKSGSWQARLPRSLSANGDQEPLPETFDSEDEARDYLNRVIEMKERGIALDSNGSITCEAAYDRWLLVKKQKALKKYPSAATAENALRTDRSCKKHLELAPFWRMPYRVVEPRDVVNFFKFLQQDVLNKNEENLSHSYINGCMTRMRQLFDYLEVIPNPCLALRRLPLKRAPITYLTPAEQRELFSSPKVQLKDRVMLGCLMSSGLRIGEFLSIEARDVELESRDPHLYVRHGGRDRMAAKHHEVGDNGRYVELTEPGLSFWRLWMEDFYVERESGRCFSGPSDGYLKHWADELRELDFRFSVYPHKMRHTYAMSVINGYWGGEPPVAGYVKFVQKQLGHQTEDVTVKHYGRVIRQVEDAARMRGENRGVRTPVTALQLLELSVPHTVPRFRIVK